MRGSWCTACTASITSCVDSDLTYFALRWTDLVCLGTDCTIASGEDNIPILGRTATKTAGAGLFLPETLDITSKPSLYYVQYGRGYDVLSGTGCGKVVCYSC